MCLEIIVLDGLMSSVLMQVKSAQVNLTSTWPGGRFKNNYELLNLRALKF